MIGRIYHVGLTVSDIDRSIAFYRDILGLEFQGELFMEGEETDKMFRKKNCKARVAYLNGSKAIEAPPVELIQFVDSEIHKAQSDLFTTSISEVCFYTDDIDSVYKTIIENHVDCLSEPQYFDFRASNAGYTYYYKVKAVSKVSSGANSYYSVVIGATCHCARPSVKITTSNGSPKLTWNAVAGANKYEVYRATSKNGSYTKMFTTSNLSYTNTSAKAGTTYYYKVKAVSKVKSTANSAFSTVVSIRAR